VERELRAYLDCGILARGFARVRCPDCGFERLVAFSCKARVCPSCNARRMEDTAEHLVRNVFPAHAGVRSHANDRQGLERLCRYIARPPFALDRLTQGEDGRLVYRMKRPRGGSLWLVLEPDELVAKLATLVPPPRVHGMRYHGVFAPNAKGRARVVPEVAEAVKRCGGGPPVPEPREEAPARPPPAAGPDAVRRTTSPREYRVPWAELLRKVFSADVLACPDCGGRLQVVAYIAEETVARRILEHLHLDATGPPLPRAQPAPEPAEPPPEYDLADPIPEE
jgi:DNA-directed RNA polymerase subunit RPC12/RpoP